MFASLFTVSALTLSRSRGPLVRLVSIPKTLNVVNNNFNVVRELKDDNPKGCRRVKVDIPDPGDPECPLPLSRKIKRQGILHKIKLKILEGGSNFGTPFRRLKFRTGDECKKEKEEEERQKEQKALPAPKKEIIPSPPQDTGVQVAILGADTMVGQYVALLLKQCTAVRKLRLYDAKECDGPRDYCEICARDTYKVAQDLQNIDTNCGVQAFSAACGELECCLQNSDIVLMLEHSSANINQPFHCRFESQAPIVKKYADAISQECPRAFIIVCATPVDCMVPLVAETLRETGWYDKRKLLGSIAVPEMRASTLAARALSLEPRYTRVPCVGGTEGESLVPLFSKAIQDFDFAKHNAEMMTTTVRMMPWDLARCECCCLRSNDLSEAHALANLVKSVAHALLCIDIPIVSGFVETDTSVTISPAKFCANPVQLHKCGITENLGVPKLTYYELRSLSYAMVDLQNKYRVTMQWYNRYRQAFPTIAACKLDGWFYPSAEERFADCAYASVH